MFETGHMDGYTDIATRLTVAEKKSSLFLSFSLLLIQGKNISMQYFFHRALINKKKTNKQ